MDYSKRKLSEVTVGTMDIRRDGAGEFYTGTVQVSLTGYDGGPHGPYINLSVGLPARRSLTIDEVRLEFVVAAAAVIKRLADFSADDLAKMIEEGPNSGPGASGT
jgi:hypothetical protein